MRLVFMVWMIFRGMSGYVFKHSYAMAAESLKVPLEIFSNPTILSDDNLFFEFCNFFTPAAEGHGLCPWMNALAFGRDVAPLGREEGCHGLCPWGSTNNCL
jgi:hypothetical protein